MNLPVIFSDSLHSRNISVSSLFLKTRALSATALFAKMVQVMLENIIHHVSLIKPKILHNVQYILFTVFVQNW